jgi:cell division septation protein DedD
MAGKARVGLGLAAMAVLLAGCGEGASPLEFLRGGAADEAVAATGGARSETRIVERDVEAPQVFRAVEPGLWDGRPSLGGVWVAYPGVQDPERVIIRNPANGRFVIGALFRRERENPGPRLQVSSDAASALGLLAGQPTTLEVVALRREEVPEAPPASPILDTAETVETEAIEATPPAAPRLAGAAAPAVTPGAVAIATAAPAAAPPAAPPAARPPAPPPARPAAPARAAAPAAGSRTLIQIGIFSVEANANRAADQIRTTGAAVNVRREESQGRTFWRVLAGPETDPARRADLLNRIKALGYADAYLVSR